MGSSSPITDSRAMCSMSSTPASRMRSPPTPTRWKGSCSFSSSRATPAAWLSPDTSPATKRISRTRSKCRCRALDVLHDLQCHRQRIAALFPRHRHGRLTAHCCKEALELEPQRLALFRFHSDALDEL